MERIRNVERFTSEINQVVESFYANPGYKEKQDKITQLKDGFRALADEIVSVVPDTVPRSLALDSLVGTAFMVFATTLGIWGVQRAA